MKIVCVSKIRCPFQDESSDKTPCKDCSENKESKTKVKNFSTTLQETGY